MGVKVNGKAIDDIAKINSAEVITAGDALVGEVKDGKFFYAGSSALKEGTLPTVALAPGSSAYPAGYHAGDGGGLPAIDADLAVGNIKDGVTIFDVLGTFAGAPTATYDRYYTTDLAALSSYTPAAAAMYSGASENDNCLSVQAWGNIWTRVLYSKVGCFGASLVVSPGTNLRFRNQSGVEATNIVLMRYALSGGIYEREYYADLAALTRYTPSVVGIFSLGSEIVSNSPKMENKYNASWWKASFTTITSAGGTGSIGDATNFSVYNISGVSAYQICLMRAKTA